MDNFEREETPVESELHQQPRSGLQHRGSGCDGALAPCIDDQQVLHDIRAMLKRQRDEVVLNVERCFKHQGQVVETLLLNRSPSLAAARARSFQEFGTASYPMPPGILRTSNDDFLKGPRRYDTSFADEYESGNVELYDGTTPNELDEMLGRVGSATKKKATIGERQESVLHRDGTASSGLNAFSKGLDGTETLRGSMQSLETLKTARSIRVTQRRLSALDLELKQAAADQDEPVEAPEPEVKEPTFKERASLCLRRFAQAVVRHTLFESFTFVIIFTNVAMVGIEVDYMATTLAEETPQAFFTIDCVYTLCFLTELIFRIIAEEPSFFYSKNWAWNYFDFMIVCSSVVETIFTLLQSTGGIDMSHFRVIRVIRVTRLIRTFRMVRLVRFIRALRTLLYSIMVTMKSLVWALLLLLMIFYGFGVAFTQAVSDHNVTEKNVPKVGDQSCVSDSGFCELITFWGTLPRAMFTLFKAIAGGVSWHAVVEPLGIVGWVWVGVFVGFIAFTFLAVLNVVTGVFCQSAIESAQQDKDIATMQLMASRGAYIDTVKRLFTDIDVDTSGAISIREFEDFLRHEKFQAYFASLDIDASDVWSLFKLMDSDQTGKIDLEEFVGGCLQLRGQAKAIQIAKMSYDNSLVRKMLVEFMDSVDERLDHLLVAAGVDVTVLTSQTLGADEFMDSAPTASMVPKFDSEQSAPQTPPAVVPQASEKEKMAPEASVKSSGKAPSLTRMVSWRRAACKKTLSSASHVSRNSQANRGMNSYQSYRSSLTSARSSTSGMRSSTSGMVLQYSKVSDDKDNDKHAKRDITL